MPEAIQPENMKVAQDNILVKRDRPITKKGNIIIPEAWQSYGSRAEIISIGPDVKADVAVGMEILFKKDCTILPFEDRTLAVTKDKFLIAKLIDKETYDEILPLDDYVLVKPSSNKIHNGIHRKLIRKEPMTGKVVRVGNKVQYLETDDVVLYDIPEVWCSENNVSMHMIRESDILAKEV